MPAHSAKDKVEIAKKICEVYAKGDYTIASCVETQGISDRTFRNWVTDVSEIADMYKDACREADKKQRGDLRQIAFGSLRRLITGFEVEEVHTEHMPIFDEQGNEIGTKAKNIKTIKKHFAPHVTAVIFALKHLDERFKDDAAPTDSEPQTFLIGGKEISF